jgi:ribosomal protein S18 acetylase RimI-like enzyme
MISPSILLQHFQPLLVTGTIPSVAKHLVFCIPLGPMTKKIRRNVRDYGLLRTFSKIVGAVMRPIFQCRTYRLYRADLCKVIIPSVTDRAFEYHFLKPTEKDCLTQILHMEEWLDGSLESIMQGSGRCLVAMDKGTIAGFNLVQYQEIHIPVVHYTRALRSRQAFSVQITVDKAYRGRGLGTTLRLEVFRALREQGMKYFYGGTDVHNQANLALCRKVGLKEIADIHYLKILWLERTTVRRFRR